MLGSALMLAAVNIAGLYQSLTQAAPAIRAVWPRATEAAAAATFMVGLLCGRVCAGWAVRLSRAAWLAVLPLPAATRARAARVTALAVGGAMLPVPALCGWGVSHAIMAPHGSVTAPAMSLCFALSFCGAALRPDRPPRQAPTTGQRREANGRLWPLAASLDRVAPRHAGLWAQGDGGRGLGLFWLLSLLLGGGFACGISLAQSWAVPSVCCAVLGGNLVFMIGLRAGPLASPVLRTSGMGFWACWLAVARVPLAFSAAWFAAAVLPVFAMSWTHWRLVAGAALALAALNLLFATATSVSVTSRRGAALLYAVLLGSIMYQGAQYGTAYGALAAAFVCGVGAVLWRQARRRFRVHG